VTGGQADALIERHEAPGAAGAARLGVLTRDFQVRILNYSPSGCLVEVNARIESGTIGSLRFVIDGSEFIDDVQVIRCHAIEGAAWRYRVGVRFLWTVAPGKGTLRGALERTNGAEYGVEATSFT
jgi:hypothetical protein